MRVMSKWLGIVALGLLSAMPVQAEQQITSVRVNDYFVCFGLIRDGITYVPLRTFVAALPGVNCDWDYARQEANLSYQREGYYYRPDEFAHRVLAIVHKEGVPVVSYQQSYIAFGAVVDGRLYVGLRYLIEPLEIIVKHSPLSGIAVYKYPLVMSEE